MGAVKAYLKEEADKINAIQVSDINKKNIALLRACAKTGKAAGQFIEVMACEGGCITGPSTHNDIVSGRRQLVQSLLKRKYGLTVSNKNIPSRPRDTRHY